MKLRSALVATIFAVLMASGIGCPCIGEGPPVGNDNGSILNAETFIFFCEGDPR